MTAPRNHINSDAFIGPDAMYAYMKGLAARLPAGGRVKSALSRAVAFKLRRIAASYGGTDALAQSVKRAALLAGQLARERPARLPASLSHSRIGIIAQELVSHSYYSLTGETMARAIEAFDSAQGLTMDEIWLFPREVRIELLKAYLSVASRLVAGAYENRWEDEAYLSNIVQSLNAVADADWEAEYAKLCRAEKILARDEVYRAQDEASKRAVRRETAKISRRSGLGEWTVARHAEGLAQKHGESPFDSIVYWLCDPDGKGELMRELTGGTPPPAAAGPSHCGGDGSIDNPEFGETTDNHRRGGLRSPPPSVKPRGMSGRPQVAPTGFMNPRQPDNPEFAGNTGFGNTSACGTPTSAGGGQVGYMAAFAALFLIITALSLKFAGGWLFVPIAVISWRFAKLILDRIVAAAVPARDILKLKFDVVPAQYRTLVVIPALLSSAKRADEAASQLAALGALTENDAIEYLLLGDFKDSPNPVEDGDVAIVARAREHVDRLNRQAGKKRYHYLHRSREYCRNDDKYMARERKRGAIMELNELLLGREARFEADDADAENLAGRFKFVITLDAGTRVLPMFQRALIGAMAHPLNRRRVENGVLKGYSVISPRVEQRQTTRFSSLAAYPGGLDAYPVNSACAYWDMCGVAAYCGKGIYDVEAFQNAVSSVVPEKAILSHDLLEGALSGAGYAGDVTILDDFPLTLKGYLNRLHRWTRGDWQLLPFMFTLPISAVSRFMMLDNLVSSLAAPMALLTIILSFVFGLWFPFIYAALCAVAGSLDSLKRAMANLALLPPVAVTSLDAAARAVYRAFFSRKSLLEWTPAADGEGGMANATAGKICALAILPGIFHGPFAPFAVGLGLLFWTGANWTSRQWPKNAVSREDRLLIYDLARDTWKYFAAVVPMDSNGLAPDNLQIYPPAEPARRTSPTNISMYLLSCASAGILGFIEREEEMKRVNATLETLEKLAKWRGQLYNWYDTATAQPLAPKYVSSVDGGNLAAGLMLLSAYYKGETGEKCEKLARDMDLYALYDPRGKLFHIGYDETSGRMSDSRYDLLASESRILSLAAIALGKVPEKHWFSLARRVSGKTLLSWSGTAFEYLMPEIFTRSMPGTLLYQSNHSVIGENGASKMGVWGVSESGYYAFDSRLNYQYRAFGLAKNALGETSDGMVIAPYATMLALLVDPAQSVKNLRRIKENGWMGEYGLYEAVDFDPARLPKGEKYKIVRSFMAHHQGMILTAAADFLTDGALSSAFSSRPDVAALAPLLEQRPFSSKEVSPAQRQLAPAKLRAGDWRRVAASEKEGHLMSGGGTSLFASGQTLCLTKRGSVDIDRFSGFFGPNDGTVSSVSVDGVQCRWSRGVFSPGAAAYTCSRAGVSCVLSVTASPGEGNVYRVARLENSGAQKRRAEVYNACALALDERLHYLAHPAFMNMTVESKMTGQNQATFIRRGREGKPDFRVVCSVFASEGAEVSLENDLSRLTGRRGPLGDISAYAEKFRFTEGFALDTCLAQKVSFTLEPGEKKMAVFLSEFGESATASVRDMADRADKSRELARARLMAELGFLSMDMPRYITCDRQSRDLVLAGKTPRANGLSGVSKNDLWEMGLDTTYPIIAAFVGREEEIRLAREAADRYLFYSLMGVKCFLALVNGEEDGYRRPVRDALKRIADGCPGEVRILEMSALSEKNLDALKLCAAIVENEPKSRDTGAKSEVEFVKPEYDARSALSSFSRNGREYAISSLRDMPAAWCNVLANEVFGCVVSERAGGFCWYKNSRLSRVTPWTGDALNEGRMLNIYLQTESGESISLVPALPKAAVVHTQGQSSFESKARGFEWKTAVGVPMGTSFVSFDTLIKNRAGRDADLKVFVEGNFLMGADPDDARLLSYDFSDGFIFAQGAAEGVGFIYMKDARESRGGLAANLRLLNGRETRFEVLLGAADTRGEAREAVRQKRADAKEYWNALLSGLTLETPDETLNAFCTYWLPYQTLSSRVFARSGFYQSGGAYGFRDQLQDMLVLITLKPSFARRHILYCAGRQFEKGDVLHWWHPPATGVRTRVSDDRVFLPYITAKYIAETGDAAILEASVPYLASVDIPENRDDVYVAAQPCDVSGALYEHCMKAIRLSAETGQRGLALMRGGDWNDGMNRVDGESVWLSEFLAATCDEYASVLPSKYAASAGELRGIADAMRRAIEENGFAGEWYYRAIYPDGAVMGGPECESCRIDLVSQSWAVLAGLDGARSRKAMEEAWNRLAGDGIIRLLTPPFVKGQGRYPGYIADYPPGVRENGGQYTHAACWAIMAWAELGQTERAYEAMYSILPYSRAKNAQQVRRYRAEPYALAADVYAGEYAGRAGWTWYTGAAAWLHRTIIYTLIGYERKGDRARISARLKKDWPEASVTVRVGKAYYKLTSRRGVEKTTLDGEALTDGWVTLKDDGKSHEAIFPPRENGKAE